MTDLTTDTNVKEFIDSAKFRGSIKYDEPMSAHTSLRIGGPAEVMVSPSDAVALKQLLVAAGREGVPVFILGGGTNLLVSDEGIDGLVVSLRELSYIERVRDRGESDGEGDERTGREVAISAGAGAPLAAILDFARKNGYSGMEALAGIPGTLGGAVCMNAGSFGIEIKDVLRSVTVMDRKGAISVLDRDGLEFSYRSSNLSGDLMILGASLVLKKDEPSAVAARMKEFLQKKKGTQPLGEPSAGCVFRNPAGESAGRLIEAAGCKGLRVGDAEVSVMHANYFLNKGKATCRDFRALMETVRDRVLGHSGVALEPEIRIVGRFDL